jgi:galactokinase
VNQHHAPRDPTLEPEALRAALMTREPEAAAHPEAIRVVRAPGRVNLIGEHTDYNEGLVMPAAIDLEVRLAFVPTDDREVTVTSLTTGQKDGFSLDAVGPARGRWIDYVAGVAAELLAAGQPVRGCRAVLASSLPQAAGLGSSGALEIAAAWALSGAEGPTMRPLDLARLAQRAENDYVGVRCGLMDQFTATSGVEGEALRFDCRSLEHRTVPLPPGHVLVVCHTGSPRHLDASAYNERRAACEAAVRALASLDPQVHALRDVDRDLLARAVDALDPVTFRRVRHVVTEIARVEATERALLAGDLVEVGRLWAASHASLRDDYEVSSGELDALVEIAAITAGVVAARMTGAGFGGCTVNLVRADAVEGLRDAVETDYPVRTGLTPTVFTVEPTAGAGWMEP